MEYENLYSCAKHVHKYLKERGIAPHPSYINSILFRVYVDFAVNRNVELFKEVFHTWDIGFVLPEIYNFYRYYPGLSLYNPDHEYIPLTNSFVKKQLERMTDEVIALIKEENNTPFNNVIRKIKSQELYKKHASNDILKLMSTYCEVPFEEIKEYYSKKGNYESLIKCFQVDDLINLNDFTEDNVL